MKFTQYARLVGLWDAIITTLVFPIWLIWHTLYFVPKIKREVAAENGGLCTDELIQEYCMKQLPMI